MNTAQVEQDIKNEMNKLNDFQLRHFAQNMGVNIHNFKSRQTLEQECIRIELYAFTH